MGITKTGSKDKYGYITECAYVMERQADYNQSKLVSELFEAVPKDFDGGHGNLCGQLVVNRKSKKSKFTKDYSKACEDERCSGFYSALPSALLMYRLACLFQGNIKACGQDGYKFTWQFALKHKKSGQIICFGEWKGGSLFWTQFNLSDVPNDFKADILKLIDVLVSDTCPHPYDGLVAGSVA